MQPLWLRKIESAQPLWFRKIESVQPPRLRKKETVQSSRLRKIESVQPPRLRKIESVQPPRFRKIESVHVCYARVAWHVHYKESVQPCLVCLAHSTIASNQHTAARKYMFVHTPVPVPVLLTHYICTVHTVYIVHVLCTTAPLTGVHAE